MPRLKGERLSGPLAFGMAKEVLEEIANTISGIDIKPTTVSDGAPVGFGPDRALGVCHLSAFAFGHAIPLTD